MQVSAFLQDSASHAEACREFAADIRRAVRTGYNGHVGDKIADIPAPGEAALLSAAVFDADLIAKLRNMGDHSLSSVLKQVSLHDTAMLPNALRMRLAALTARLADGALSLSDAMAIGADDVREGYACQSMFREYAPFIGELQLRRLDLARNGLCCSDGMALQHVLSAQLHLQHLDLSSNTDPSPESIMPAISSATSLTFIDLSNCFQYNGKEPILQPMGHLSHLSHLNILGCQVPMSELRDNATVFTALTALTHLQMGSFHELELGTAAAITHLLPPTICHLTLSWGEQVSLAQTTYATLPDGLRRLTALTYLCLGDPTCGPSKYGKWPPEHATLSSVFAALGTLPHLTHFAAPQLRAPRRALTHLSTSPSLRALALTPELDPALSELTQLTSLHIHSDACSSHRSRWCHLKPLVALESLRLHKFVESPAAQQALRAALAGAAPTLSDFELDVFVDAPGWPGADGGTVALFTQLTCLTRLVVTDWKDLCVGPEGFARAVAPLRRLRHLSASGIGCAVGDPCGAAGDAAAGDAAEGDAAAPAARRSLGATLGESIGGLTELTELRLTGMDMPGKVDLVGALSTLRALRVLGLKECALATPEVAALAELLQRGVFPALEELNVAHNSLTAAAVAALADGLPAARRLRHLDMHALCGHEFERPREKYSTDDESIVSDEDGDGDSDGSGGSDADSDLHDDMHDDGEGDEAGEATGEAALAMVAEVLAEAFGGHETESSDSSSDGSMGVAELDVVELPGGSAGSGPGSGAAGASSPETGMGAAVLMAMAMAAGGGSGLDAWSGSSSSLSGGSSSGEDAPGQTCGVGESAGAELAATAEDGGVAGPGGAAVAMSGSEQDSSSEGSSREDMADTQVRAGPWGRSFGGDGGSSRSGSTEGEGSAGADHASEVDMDSADPWVLGLLQVFRATVADTAAAAWSEYSGNGACVAAGCGGAVSAAAAAEMVANAHAEGPMHGPAVSGGEVAATGAGALPASDADTAALAAEPLGGGAAAAGIVSPAEGPSMDELMASMAQVTAAAHAQIVALTADLQAMHDAPAMAVAAIDGSAGVDVAPSGASADVVAAAADVDPAAGAPAEAAAAAAAAEEDGADDEDMPWWHHEASAGKLWEALLRLPLDRGVEL